MCQCNPGANSSISIIELPSFKWLQQSGLCSKPCMAHHIPISLLIIKECTLGNRWISSVENHLLLTMQGYQGYRCRSYICTSWIFWVYEVNSVRMPGASCLLVTEVLKKMYFIATFEVVLKDIFWRHFVKHTHNCKHINKS